MSNLEHLIENTLVAIDYGLDANEIKRRIKNDVNFKGTNISVNDIWELCQYFKYTWCMHCSKNKIRGVKMKNAE